ncbi:O-methyltransferase [Tessaracoccus antarcticus]|uniref:O-methyltransferase n=1 Tax=Tessaracoccus antarcticus TaxID=2479848 RepID=A0A3M0G9B2_9ACTN|nr:O-methyltransferase [Tessaracoccus antarcticus]RMB61544.1 O-methyltransferase [Tessaracoccus antarcticus]
MDNRQIWNDVDDYLNPLFAPDDDVLTAALRDSDSAGLPQIAVAPNQGKLLQLLAGLVGARRILEIGTLGGYSTIRLARVLPADGRLVTLEYEPRHAEVARGNIARAGLDMVVEVRVGPALDALPLLLDEEQFDMVFIDADKENNPHYVEWAVKLTRPGGLVVLDNVVRKGRIVEPGNCDPDVVGTRRALELMAHHPRLDGVAIQTVGTKGHDGLAIARVLD